MIKLPNYKKTKGFTLIEMLVAIFVFTAIMTIATGAIFSVVAANKTSQALKSVLDNLSGALDSMSRNIRYGDNYICGDPGVDFDHGRSCPEGSGGDTEFAFTDKDGDHVIYVYNPAIISQTGTNPGIFRCLDSVGDNTCTRLTAAEVNISDMHFYVQGANSNELRQPQLLITISGSAQAGPNPAKFNIETMIDQRNLTFCKTDIPPIYKEHCPSPI